MKKLLPFFIAFTCMVTIGVAQVPTFFNTNVTGGANTFPLGNTGTSRKVQWFIPPNSLGAVTAGNNITKVYFQTGSSTTVTYPILTVKLKVGSGTGLTGVAAGPVEPGMTVVYTGANVVVTTTAGAWYGITLTTPFLYNPAQPLIVELEHNGTIAGTTLYQATNIPGPGNGRQWADYNVANLTGVAATQINFGIDVLPAVPCTGVPSANSVAGPTAAICPNATANMNVTNTYTAASGGISYQWQSSTTSSVGPFIAIPNATTSSYAAPNVTVNTWYNALITCSAAVGTTTSSPLSVSVSPVITGNVPYYESLESIGMANELPNCSWSASNLPANCQTYIGSNTLGRTPRTGTKFAAFYYSPAGTRYFYTNGINLVAGVTYSASVWFQTDYQGTNNWSDLSILYGTTQTPTGLVSIASTNGPAISNVYKSLSGTFSVPTSGLYYFAIRGTGIVSGTAQYLTWDDFAVEIPCGPSSPNTPSLSLITSTTSLCAGESVNLAASGADTYTWSNNANTSAITESPVSNITYTVIGTNSLTGCTSMSVQSILVNPAPSVFIFATSPSVCAGSPVNLSAVGANSFTWTTGALTQAITVSPTVTTTYSVLASNALGCTGSASQLVSVNQLPNVTANTNIASQICVGEVAVLTAGGAVSYQWISNTSPLILQGNPVNVSPNITTIYTVTGTDANGCQKKATVLQNVDACVGLQENTNTSGVKVYPNPTNGEFMLESTSGLNSTIQIVDLSGRVVSTIQAKNEKVKISMTHFANGVYYVKVLTNNSVDVIKVVKQ